MLGMTGGGNVGVKGAGTFLEVREWGWGGGLLRDGGGGRIGGKFSTIFCNRIKTQDVGTTKKGGGETRFNGQWEAGIQIPSPSPHLMFA